MLTRSIPDAPLFSLTLRKDSRRRFFWYKASYICFVFFSIGCLDLYLSSVRVFPLKAVVRWSARCRSADSGRSRIRLDFPKAESLRTGKALPFSWPCVHPWAQALFDYYGLL